VEPILTGYERQTQRDQAAFKAAVEKLGGRVYIQYWLVNAAAIEIPFASLAEVRRLPNVLRLEPNLPAEPMILTATGAANHNSDAVNNLGFKGKGIATAILDTGLDGNNANQNRPHRTFYEDGDLSKRNRLVANLAVGSMPPDNAHPHGTGVAGITAGGNWGTSRADHGHAPHADIVGISISNSSSGGSSHATQAAGWQALARDAVKYNIKTANSSYSGSPDPLNTSQQALDAAALNADVMIVVAAGNYSSRTSSSISCANGLAVGAVNPTSHTMASFSSRGPLYGDTERFYPDLAACGVNTVMPRADNESTDYVASGTSMASPQVCGAATLVRSANTQLRADTTKAILLATALDIHDKNPTAPYNTRNAYGMGLLKDDAAVLLALKAKDHGRAQVSSSVQTWTTEVQVQKGLSYRAAVSWMRQTMTSKNWSDLNLEVLQGSSVIASSTTPRNLYEVAFFRAPATTTLTLRVKGVSIENGKQDFGWAFTQGSIPPIPASYQTFGVGCASGSLGCGVCYGENWTQTSANTTTSATQVAILLTSSVQSLCGVELLTRARGSTAVTCNIALHELSSNVTPGNQIAQGTMVVGTQLGPWLGKFNKTLSVSGGTYLVYDNADKIYLPESTSGNLDAYCLFSGSWSTVTVDKRFQYRVHCDRGFVTPRLSTSGKPILGQSMDVELASAPSQAPAMFLAGLSNSQWGSTPLPFKYAGTCQLLVSPDVATMLSTTSVGTAKVSLWVPNKKGLIGLNFYNQFLVTNNVNAFGVITSNAGQGAIGEY